MTTFKIFDGTRPTKRLCDSCKFSHIIKGTRQEEEIVFCKLLEYSQKGGQLNFAVVECSDYQDKKSMDQYEMEKIAWIIEVKGRTFMGFKPPSKNNG